MTKKSFLHLLAKEISGTISTDEKKMLDESREENPTFDRVYTEVQRFMQTKHHQPVVDVEGKLDEVWRRIHTQLEPEEPDTPKRIVPLWARIAAAAIVAGLVVLAYNRLPNERMLHTQTLQTGDENLYAVLDDGTQVWLSKHSQLAYNKNFGEKKRKIRLTGEAFFDVAHRPEVPLTVSANEVDVTVKGTAFNVNATQPDVEVALVRGLVSVKESRRKNSEGFLLHPNQKVTVGRGKVVINEHNYQVTQTNDTIVPETRWLNDALVFRKQRFADIAKLMQERYGVRIEIQNFALREQRFTGSIKNESIEQMLDALKQSYPFEYEITDKKVVVK